MGSLKDRLQEINNGGITVSKKINQDIDTVLTEEIFSNFLVDNAQDNDNIGYLRNSYDSRLKVYLVITKIFYTKDDVIAEYYLTLQRDRFSYRLKGNTNTYNSNILLDLQKLEVQDNIEHHIKDIVEQFEDIIRVEVFNCSGADRSAVASNGFNLVYEISFTNPLVN